MADTTTTDATLPDLLAADLSPVLARVLPAENPVQAGAFNSMIAPYETPVAVLSLPAGQKG